MLKMIFILLLFMFLAAGPSVWGAHNYVEKELPKFSNPTEYLLELEEEKDYCEDKGVEYYEVLFGERGAPICMPKEKYTQIISPGVLTSNYLTPIYD